MYWNIQTQFELSFNTPTVQIWQATLKNKYFYLICKNLREQ